MRTLRCRITNADNLLYLMRQPSFANTQFLRLPEIPTYLKSIGYSRISPIIIQPSWVCSLCTFEGFLRPRNASSIFSGTGDLIQISIGVKVGVFFQCLSHPYIMVKWFAFEDSRLGTIFSLFIESIPMSLKCLVKGGIASKKSFFYARSVSSTLKIPRARYLYFHSRLH